MQISVPASTGTKTAASGKHPVFPVGHMMLFVLVTVLFFLWGMSNNLTDILVQQFKKSLELSQFSAQLRRRSAGIARHRDDGEPRGMDDAQQSAGSRPPPHPVAG